MITQREFVEGCLKYYAENYYEPGNPEDGEWHECHYPVPKCLGGAGKVKLLKQHHAIQGVLQSEEFNTCCVWSWEAKYLEGEMLELYKKWKSEHMKRMLATLTPEEILQRNKRSREATTAEQRSEAAKRREASKTPEQRSEASRKGRKKQLEKMTPEERKEIGRRLKGTRTPESRSAATSKGNKTRRQLREATLQGTVNRTPADGLPSFVTTESDL